MLKRRQWFIGYLFYIPCVVFSYQAPEINTGKTNKPLVFGHKTMVVTNNPWASLTANQILKKGGNAVDAAIAATIVLGLTEPQSSGLGGGGYALTYNGTQKKVLAYDGRETAPQSATPYIFLNQHNQPLNLSQAMLSPHSIGVPGEVALLYRMHQNEGILPWAQLIQPAINLAKKGFPLSPRLHKLLKQDISLLIQDPDVKSIYFTKKGNVKNIGQIIRNPQLAQTLKRIAKNPMDFYHGKIAHDIVGIVNQNSKRSIFSLNDLAHYSIKISKPLCDYFRDNKICTAPPSAGGISVLELLKIYAAKYTKKNIDDATWLYTFLEASKLTYADRNQYIADPTFVKQPIMGLLADDYIQLQRQRITKTALKSPIKAGIPKGADLNFSPDASKKPHGTTSLAMVDQWGNAAVLTVTIEHQFGSHIFVDGFFLNNELTDFSLIPIDRQGNLIANRVEALKRPRSSIAPIMVFNSQNQLALISASPGGSPIICYVAKNIIQMLDFKLNPQQSSAFGNACAQDNVVLIEAGSNLIPYIPELKNRGQSVQLSKQLTSGVVNIMRTSNNGWWGAADPRREGVALGQ